MGRIISDTWLGKIKRTCTVEEGRGYRHLKSRARKSTDDDAIYDLGRFQGQLQLLCDSHHGWVIASGTLDTHAVNLVKVCSENGKEIAVDGRRLAYELRITLLPPGIFLATYKNPVSISDIINSTDDVIVSIRAIDVAMSLVEATLPCLRQEIPSDDSEFLRDFVSALRIVTVTNTGDGQENDTRLVSRSCSLLTSRNKMSCENCLYAYKLFRKRRYNRKADNNKTPNKKCNVRYLSRKGLEYKISEQRKAKKVWSRQEDDDGMVEFIDADSADLVKMFQAIDVNGDTVPKDMELLWSQQIKQLSTKSAKGFRWNPRFGNLIISLVVCQLTHKILYENSYNPNLHLGSYGLPWISTARTPRY